MSVLIYKEKVLSLIFRHSLFGKVYLDLLHLRRYVMVK